MPMKIRTRDAGEVLIVDLQGNLTVVDGADQLRDHVKKLVDQGHRKLLFNLRQTGHIDSAGIGAIVACYTLANKKRGVLKLLCLDAKLDRLLSVVERFDDEQAALESF